MTALKIKGYALVTVMFAILILSISFVFIHTGDDVFIKLALNRIELLK